MGKGGFLKEHKKGGKGRKDRDGLESRREACSQHRLLDPSEKVEN